MSWPFTHHAKKTVKGTAEEAQQIIRPHQTDTSWPFGTSTQESTLNELIPLGTNHETRAGHVNSKQTTLQMRQKATNIFSLVKLQLSISLLKSYMSPLAPSGSCSAATEALVEGASPRRTHCGMQGLLVGGWIWRIWVQKQDDAIIWNLWRNQIKVEYSRAPLSWPPFRCYLVMCCVFIGVA